MGTGFYAALLSLFGVRANDLSQITVKILTQKRVFSLNRLLASLEAASYPKTANIDIEIHLDKIPQGLEGPADENLRRSVMEVADAFVEKWEIGSATILEGKIWRGVRGMWLACANGGIYNEEFTRFVVFEDDVELSPAWFEYVAAAHSAYSTEFGVAGISLQRQMARMDAYASELSGKSFHLSKNQALASLRPAAAPGTSYLFPHVGSWGFSPEPKVWHDFLDWFDNLRDVDSAENWITLVSHDHEDQDSPHESLPSRWYRHALNTQRGELSLSHIGVREATSSMWTAHFDAYCAWRGLLVLHPHVFELSNEGLLSEVGLARSWLDDGAHYVGINQPDGHLLGMDTWRNELLSGKQADLFPQGGTLARLTHAGYRVSNLSYTDAFEQLMARGRRLSELDVYWELDGPLALNDLPQAVTGDTFGYYDPLVTITKEQAQCILAGKSVVILGDSISRYFTFQFNNFLLNGNIASEWGNFAGGCTKWGCGVKEDDCYVGPYFDCGTTWNGGTDRSDSSSHRQYLTLTIDGGDYGNIQTAFYFIQDTWYGDLEKEASTIREYDVIIANSGWWELKEDDNEDHKSDSCSFSDNNDVSDFYTDPDCLDSYEDDLGYLINGVLRYFVSDDDKAAVWRAVTCCGVDDPKVSKQRIGAIAVGAMNTIAEKVMADNSVDVVPVYQLSNIMNLGTGQGDGRTFDGFHPRSNQMQIWTHLCLNKISKQLKKVECLASPSIAPTARPIPEPTKNPSQGPIPQPSILPTPNPTLEPSSPLPSTARPSTAPTTATPTSLTCTNGIRDGAETDVDCGGETCNKCSFGLHCEETTDCRMGVCNSNICDPRPSTSPTELPTAIPASIPTPNPSSASPTAPKPTTPVPSPGPTLYPIASPTTSAPAIFTLEPTKIPRPWPTKQPTIWIDPDADTGFSYGGGENVREVASCVSSNDGITYKNKPALDFMQCPTTGQIVLLAILTASCFSYACALALQPRTTESNYRTFQTLRDRTTGSFVNCKASVSRLEDELSNSALQVLRQMEDIEIRSGPTQLASVAECDEETDELGATAKSPTTSRGQLPSASRHRTATNRTGLQSGSTRDGSSYIPRTSISLVSKTLSVSGVSMRTSSYAEPHLDTKVSSVAFSFYDGGDSDEEEGSTAIVAAKSSDHKAIDQGRMLGTNHKIYETARTALEFGLLLGICVVGEHRMPSGLLPAGTTLSPENPDLWCFVMVLIFLVSLLNIEVLEAGTEVFLSRAQANEWKGWMQVAFVAYHYTNNNDIYVPIRWCVSAYVWLTGFGNGVYFWSSADFSFKRCAQQLWRMNFLCLFLSLATGTPWIEYYFVALATVHFTLIWFSLALARAFGYFIAGWRKPNKKENREACYSEKACGCTIMIGLCCLIWLDPHDDGKGIYDVLFRPCLSSISEHFEWYFWMRTKMDFLSSIPGLCFAAIYRSFRDAWPNQISCRASWGVSIISLILLVAAIWVSQLSQYCCHGGANYRNVNPYIGTLWIPSYLLARNSSPWLSRRIMKPIEWIGMHSLEFYLLQFHVFLTSASRRILYLIPKENWGYTNMCLTGCIYFIVVLKALEVTNVLRTAAWRASRQKVILSILWTIAAYTTLADIKREQGECSRTLWGVWFLWCALATCLFTYWTVREDDFYCCPKHGTIKEPPGLFPRLFPLSLY